ncbi:MAG: phage holin family protein [Muribaculaceae bacterium]|nr:phage holin family protein [Muribaculaceae bacterium]
MDNNQIDYRRLYEEGKRLLRLEFNYTKLTAVEKLSVLLSTMAFVAVVAVLGAFVLFYLASTLVMTIAELTGNEWSGNLIVTALLLAAIAVVVAMRKTLIVNPITRFLTKLLLNPDDNE